MRFEWDPVKAASNVEKHGLSFEEASTLFGDPLSRSMPDPQHSRGEKRYVILGRTSTGRIALAVFTERGESIRLITARLATRKERRRYEQAHEK